ncbi:GNAT family N-acetyltransferase [Actinopolymorpha rutila]|uniref:GNAT superfamily N-acetyltransferase n=1 Tax=Actinopolymorpha rutila TaxID=446787 RepID=A0A852ZIF7_9ACTN|nr:GNAT family N-acetyltransferase [Actinopolymorpha rutila]NYH88880.1 GNAT superfamily N-acetyltransferase [Actinopolymorpha rutila]
MARAPGPGPGPDEEFSRAVEVFARGYSFVRSATHPYLCERMEGTDTAWVLRDAPRRDPRRYRREEWVGHGPGAADLDELARAHARTAFVLSVIRRLDEPDGPLRSAYRSRGFRLLGVEPLMIHRLGRVPASPAARTAEGTVVRITRVTTPALAERLGTATRRRPLGPDRLAEDGPQRQYAALAGGEIVGWVSSVVVRLADDSVATWCADMYVVAEHRRRGIARALLARLLRDDRRYASTASVLTASRAGTGLYRGAGYDQLGELLLLQPPKL